MSEVSGFMLKPEVVHLTSQIISEIESRIEIISSFELELTEFDVEAIYFKSDSDFLVSAKECYVGKKIVAGLVFGRDAISKLSDIVGRHYDPSKCDAASLRRMFGQGTAMVCGKAFFLNGIHRPADAEDAAHFVKWYVTR